MFLDSIELYIGIGENVLIDVLSIYTDDFIEPWSVPTVLL